MPLCAPHLDQTYNLTEREGFGRTKTRRTNAIRRFGFDTHAVHERSGVLPAIPSELPTGARSQIAVRTDSYPLSTPSCQALGAGQMCEAATPSYSYVWQLVSLNKNPRSSQCSMAAVRGEQASVDLRADLEASHKRDQYATNRLSAFHCFGVFTVAGSEATEVLEVRCFAGMQPSRLANPARPDVSLRNRRRLCIGCRASLIEHAAL